MTFSIVVPVCNGEKFIEYSIESAINQNYEGQYEIIIVENGSADNTAAICDRLAETYEHITVIHMGKIGLYMARQEGIKRANGDYIIALDADDKLDPMLLDELSMYIKDMIKSGDTPDLVYYNAADLDTGKALNHFPFEQGVAYTGETKKVFADLVCEGDSLNAMWIKCIRRDIADLGIDKKGLNHGEDLFQTVYYIDRAQRITYLDKVLYYYRENPESLTSTYSDGYIDNQKFVWNEVDRITDNWSDGAYKTDISYRKALTCAINVAKIIYSDLSIKKKEETLSAFMNDSFYKTYALGKLPDWAPEESVYVHKLMKQEDALKVLMANARKHTFKCMIKKVFGR